MNCKLLQIASPQKFIWPMAIVNIVLLLLALGAVLLPALPGLVEHFANIQPGVQGILEDHIVDLIEDLKENVDFIN